MRMLFIFLIAFVAFISKVAAKDKFECNREFIGCNSQCGITHEKDDFVGIHNCNEDCSKKLKDCVKSNEAAKDKFGCNKEYIGCNFQCGITHEKDDFMGIHNCNEDCSKKLKDCVKTATK